MAKFTVYGLGKAQRIEADDIDQVIDRIISITKPLIGFCCSISGYDVNYFDKNRRDGRLLAQVVSTYNGPLIRRY